MDVQVKKSVQITYFNNNIIKFNFFSKVFNNLQLIKRLINYGYIPKNFNIGVIHPIIKDEHDQRTRSNNNIRPITLSDVLCNIFEKYILSTIEKWQCIESTREKKR